MGSTEKWRGKGDVPFPMFAEEADMDFSSTIIYKDGVNPAVSLYRYWRFMLQIASGKELNRKALDARGVIDDFLFSATSPYYGPASIGGRTVGLARRFGIGVVGLMGPDPVLGFGYQQRTGGVSWTSFILYPNGDFHVTSRNMYPSTQALMENSFLGCARQRGKWRWGVNLQHGEWSMTPSWRNPKPVFWPRAIHTRQLLRLELENGEWVIKVAPHGEPLPAHHYRNPKTITPHDDMVRLADEYRLAARMYRLQRRDHFRTIGENDPEAPTRGLLVNGKKLDANEGAKHLAVHLNIVQPAKAKLLRPIAEEAITNDNLDSAHLT